MSSEPKQVELDKLSLSLGAKIRALRVQRDLKIAELAEMTGVTPSLISQLERALTSPSISTLKKICNVLEIPIAYLFDEAYSTEYGNITTDIGITEERKSLPLPIVDLELYSRVLPPVNLMGASPVVHRKNRKFLSPSKGIRFYLLTPNLSGPIELIYNEYDPGGTTGTISHPGSECGLVMSGELTVKIKDDVFLLKEGDSITFNSFDPHMLRNDSNEMCTCVWANVPPWF